MPAPVRHHAVIVGGGLSAIGMAATLCRQGVDDYALLERGDGLGGTWHHNWEEIRDYLLDVAEEFDVPRHARLGVEMRSAAWDDEDRVWRIETSAGPLESHWLFLAGAFRPRLGRVLEQIPRAWLRLRVRDRALRATLTPSYAMGCKRLLVDNAFYGAVQQPNLELVDSGVTRIGARSVVAANGVEREVDSLVFATGFRYGVGPSAGLVRGRDGRTLAQVWNGSPCAYLGTSVAGSPNLVLLWGPNTGTPRSRCR